MTGLVAAWDGDELVVYDRRRPHGRARLIPRAGALDSARLEDYAAAGLRCARLVDARDGAVVGGAGGSAVADERLEEVVVVRAAELDGEGRTAALRAMEAEAGGMDVLGRAWRADAVRARDGGWLVLLRSADATRARGRNPFRRARTVMDPAAAAAAEAQPAEQAPAVVAAAGWSWHISTESNLTSGRDGWRTTSWCMDEIVVADDPRLDEGWAAVVEAAIGESVVRAEDDEAEGGGPDTRSALAAADEIERWLDGRAG